MALPGHWKMRDWGEAVKEAAKIQNHNEKKDGQRGSERGGQRDADQLITAANKMQIYPGTVSMPKFKHSAIQKIQSCAGAAPVTTSKQRVIIQ